MIHRCTFEGCHRSVELPEVYRLPPPGWVHLSAWGPGVPDGLYCQPHADALEALLESGELDTLQIVSEKSRAS